MINILIIEDNEIVSDCLCHIISDAVDMKIVAIIDAINEDEAFELINNANIDIVLIDSSVKNNNGFHILKQIRNYSLKLPVLMLSFFTNAQYLDNALMYGANGLINKMEATEGLVFIVRQIVANNNCFISLFPNYNHLDKSSANVL